MNENHVCIANLESAAPNMGIQKWLENKKKRTKGENISWEVDNILLN